MIAPRSRQPNPFADPLRFLVSYDELLVLSGLILNVAAFAVAALSLHRWGWGVRIKARYHWAPIHYMHQDSTGKSKYFVSIPVRVRTHQTPTRRPAHSRRLTHHVLGSEIWADYATIFFCFNPASIFYSAVYTESLFAAASFVGMLLVEKQSFWAGVFCFALAAAARSNGKGWVVEE